MRTTLSLFLIVPTLLLAGCGTILNGTYQKIGVSSSPTGANVMVDGTDIGKTPVIVEVKRNGDHRLRFTLDGYEPYEMLLTCKLNGWVVIGDIFLTGLIGLGIDAVTGAMYSLTPEEVRAEMRKDGTGAVTKDGDLYVTVVMTPDPNWEKIGQLVPAK